MLGNDITLNSLAQTPAGTDAATTYSILEMAGGKSTRASAADSATNPRTLKIAHSQRVLKGRKLATNSSVPGPDLIFDRRLYREDVNQAQTLILDPNGDANLSVQVVIETPRLGADSPSVIEVADAIKRFANFMTASSNANLIRFLNGEL
jgi:hypothetical protein